MTRAANSQEDLEEGLPTPRERLLAYLWLGAKSGLLLGGSHALAEASLMELLGIALRRSDLILLTTAYCLAGLVAGLLVSLLIALVRGFRTMVREHEIELAVALLYLALTPFHLALKEAPAATVLGPLLIVGAALGAIILTTRGSCGSSDGLRGLRSLLLAFATVGGIAYLLEKSGAVSFLAALGPALVLLICVAWSTRLKWVRLKLQATTNVAIPGVFFALALTLALNPLRWARAVVAENLGSGLASQKDGNGTTHDSIDIFLVILDTVRADHLDLFGYSRETMPRLKQFAQAEADFAFPIIATSPGSTASHASMFTGFYPSMHGSFVAQEGVAPLASELPTLASKLTEIGYQTGGVSANFGPLSAESLSRGFTHYDASPGPRFRARKISWMTSLRILKKRPFYIFLSVVPEAWLEQTLLFDPREPSYRRAELINEAAFAYLQDIPADQPAFLFLNYFDAHHPYIPDRQTSRQFTDPLPDVPWIGFPSDYELWNKEGSYQMAPQELEFLIGQYDAELSALDQELERLIEHLRRIGRYDQSLILMVGDHGEAFLEHGALIHSSTLYQTQISVPLILKLPERVRSTHPSISQHFQFVDILPTVLHLLQEPSLPTDGRPFGLGRDFAIAELLDSNKRHRCAVVADDLKYIRSQDGGEEFFALATDPLEQQSLEPIADFDRLAREICDEQASKALISTMPSTDPALQERLRALGYIQ